MKNFTPLLVVVLGMILSLTIPQSTKAQLPLYVEELEIVLKEVRHQVSCDETFPSGTSVNPEPVIDIYAGHSGANFGSLYHFYEDDIPCGFFDVPDFTLNTFNNLCGATELSIDLTGWEEDCGGSFGTDGGNDEFYDSECCYGFYIGSTCIGGSGEDEGFTSQILNYDFQANIPEGVTTELELNTTNSNFGVKLDVTWSSLESVQVNGPVSICAGENSTLTASHFGSGPTTGIFNWYADMDRTIPIGTPGSSTLNVSPLITTTYYVTEVFMSGQCESLPTAYTVNVNGSVVAPAVNSPVEVCLGETVELNATGPGVINWYVDAAGTLFIGSGSPFTYGPMTAVGTTTVYATAFDGTCESPVASLDIIVSPAPLSPTAMDQSTCPGGFATLEAMTGGASGNFTWYADADGTVPLGTGGTFVTPSITLPSFTYYLGETDPATGCESSPLTPVTVTTDLTLSPPGFSGDTDLCAGESTTLFGIGGGTFNWYADAAGTSLIYTGNTFNTVPLTSDVTFYLTTSSSGCESPATPISVTVNPLPFPLILGSSFETVCSGESITLIANGDPGNIIRWYDEVTGTSLAGSGNNFTTPDLTQNTTYYVAQEDANGCQSNLVEVQVNVLPLPTPPGASDATVCNSGSTTLTASGSGGDITWYGDSEGTVVLGTGASYITPNLTATTSYYVSETDGNGCESLILPVVVTVEPVPAAPSVDDVAVCQGGTVTLFAGAGSFNWYDAPVGGTLLFSGSSYSIPNVTFPVTVYVAAEVSGCESPRDEVNILVNASLPIPAIDDNLPVCEGETLTLTTDLVSTYVYEWILPDGSTGSSNVLTVNNVSAITNSGTYILNVTETATGCSATNSVFVSITPTPQTVPLFTNSPVCEGGTITLESSSVPGATYTWVDNTGATLGTTSVPLFTIPGVLPGDSGVYGVSIEVAGCSSPLSTATVTVSPTPVAPSVSNDGPACEGGSVTISAATMPDALYAWTDGSGTLVANTPSFTIEDLTPADAGDYTLIMTIGGCVSAPATTTVVVNAAPSVPSAPTSNSPLCEGETLNLDGPTIAGVSYAWTGPSGFTSTEEDPSIPNVNDSDNQGVYTLVVTDLTTGCPAPPVSVFVQVDETPTGISAFNSGPVCEGQDIALSVTSIFGAEYAWTGPSGFVSSEQSPVITNATVGISGTYFVEVTVGNCTSIALETEVLVNAAPSIDAGPDITVTQGESVQLTASGGISYTWSPADYLNFNNIPNPTATGMPPGIYVIDVVGVDGNLCSGSDQIQITVEENQTIEAVDLITPNGDGVNDTWVVVFLENFEKVGYTLQIYARGGTLIYETENYTNDWDGTYEGDELPDGTYWYHIRTNDEKVFKGAITIKR